MGADIVIAVDILHAQLVTNHCMWGKMTKPLILWGQQSINEELSQGMW